jgi:Fe-S-cluster-containing dehydrogenase component/formate-dependent nitrite reductase membrane component NrfD
MKYGFIIDNRKCIGCHACTVACKSEHDVPVGVNRTWVKQVEKGTFPHTQRVFSVMRCNHCTDAPCVEICPVEALHIREDGIVDFDNQRCIGCKACTQACPYDALYIDPQTNTAAKCNYCAHRVDVGLEPACVNVCPEHAIISGDMEDPTSEIFELLNTQKVTVRKAEKGTSPNLFYINGDQASLNPTATDQSDVSLWGSQSGGVGHFAKYADQKLQSANPQEMAATLANGKSTGKTQIEAIMDKARRVYDAPQKGTLWGWEVSAYVWTKAISAGAVLVPALAHAFGWIELTASIQWVAIALGLIFLGITGGLLIKDLDQPTRFHYLLLRPQWRSWLVKGGFFITGYGAVLTLWAVSLWFGWDGLTNFALWASAIFAALTAVYTAFLFAQAKGRDFWQSPILPFHMLGHSFMAGAAAMMLTGLVWPEAAAWDSYLSNVLMVSLVVNLLIILFELGMPHPTTDAKQVVKMILKGQYRNTFWVGTLLLGNLLPLVLLFSGAVPAVFPALLVLVGIYMTEHIWVQAPQQIPLS